MRITDEDKSLFHASVSGVRRLRPVKAPPRPAPPPAIARQTRADREAILREMAEARGFDEGEAYRRAGVSPRVCRELRAGRYVIAAELDLHGARSSELGGRLTEFLREARISGKRCVRIVHGKGLNSPGRAPVLKDQVQRLLRRRSEVLAFCTAPANDGGTGALYVLLAR